MAERGRQQHQVGIPSFFSISALLPPYVPQPLEIHSFFGSNDILVYHEAFPMCNLTLAEETQLEQSGPEGLKRAL